MSNNQVICRSQLKQLCTSFYYWWHNQPGSNTEQGFEQWCMRPDVQTMLAAAPEVEQEPYAYEYGRDNGDGTLSVVMNKGMLTQLGENEYGYCHPGIFASKEWPVTPLYLRPQSAPEAAKLVEALQSLLDMQDEDCRYDHQGYCQNHNLDHVDEGCRVAKARYTLMVHQKGGDV